MLRRTSSLPGKFRIGLVMNYFRPEILEGVHSYCVAHGLELDTRWAIRADWMPDHPGWDGVLHYLLGDEATLRRAQKAAPAVIAMHPSSVEGAGAVLADVRQCGVMAAEALLQAEPRPTYGLAMTDPPEVIKLFLQGAREHLTACGRGDCWREIPLTEEQRPSGVLAEVVCDALARDGMPASFPYPRLGTCITVQMAMAERGMQVPRDLMMVAVDLDLQRAAEWAPVPISAVKLDEWNQGFRAAERLHSLLKGSPDLKAIELIPPLAVEKRSSTQWAIRKDPYVERALGLIDRLYSRKLTVDELAARLNLGRRTLELRFRHETGHSVHEALTAKRLETAKLLLRRKVLAIAEVAEHCGYGSVHHFTKAFGKASGTSPARWRDAAAEKGR